MGDSFEKSFDATAPTGAASDLTGLIAAKQAEGVPAPAAAPSTSGLQPGETVAGASGTPVTVHKSFVPSVAGAFTDLSGQLPGLQAATQPDPAARRDFVAPAPSPTQPGETVGSGDGNMVTQSPSASGGGAMQPGAGNRS